MSKLMWRAIQNSHIHTLLTQTHKLPSQILNTPLRGCGPTIWLGWPAKELQEPIFATLPHTPILELQAHAAIPGFLCEFSGSKFRSSCLCSRHFTNRANFSALGDILSTGADTTTIFRTILKHVEYADVHNQSNAWPGCLPHLYTGSYYVVQAGLERSFLLPQ